MKGIKIVIIVLFVWALECAQGQILNVEYRFTAAEIEMYKANDTSNAPHILLRNTTRDGVAIYFDTENHIGEITLKNAEGVLIRTVNTPQALREPKVSFTRMPEGRYWVEVFFDSSSVLLPIEIQTFNGCIRDQYEFNDKPIYYLADTVPSFKGGKAQLEEYLHAQLPRYTRHTPIPDSTQYQIQFVVDIDGSIHSPCFGNTSKPSKLQQIQLNLLNLVINMPSWSPGQSNGAYYPMVEEITIPY